MTRVIDRVYASDGTAPHSLAYSASEGIVARSDGSWQGKCREFLCALHDGATRTIEETRKEVLDFLGTHGETS